MSGRSIQPGSGTDEHGTPIQVQADAEGVTARELADRYNRVIVEDLAGLDMSYDLFTRTTTRNHYSVVQEMFLGLYNNGYIFPRKTLGAVSPTTGRTLPDRYIEGTCPICGYDSARGDQRRFHQRESARILPAARNPRRRQRPRAQLGLCQLPQVGLGALAAHGP